MNTQDPVQTLLQKAEEAGVCMLTTTDTDGRLVSRPMAIQEIGDDHSIWFIARLNTPKVDESIGEQQVNVTVAAKGFWASIAGSVTMVQDPERKKKYWTKTTEAFFGDSQPEDPDIVLLRVDSETGEYWDSPGLPATAVEMVKGMLNDDKPARPGDSHRVDL